MRTIAEKEGISRKYLHALLTSLRAAGLVRSVRGAAGGYVLTRHPGKVKLSEVLQVLEGTIAISDCVKDETICSRSQGCIGQEIWSEISTALERLLGGITMEEVINRHSAREQVAPMYYI